MTAGETIRDLLQRQARARGEAPFLIFPEREQTLSYAQLADGCAGVSRLLSEWGVVRGEKVALLLPNIPEFCLFYWGAMAIGAVAAPINTLLKAPEIQFIVDHCEAGILVTTREFLPELARIAEQLPHLRRLVVIPDPAIDAATESAPQAAFPWPRHDIEPLTLTTRGQRDGFAAQGPLSADDEAMIIYTSGTTGKPKGVLLTHGNLIANATTIFQWFSLDENSRFMCVLPLFHVNGEVVTLMTPLACGASVVLCRKFSASQFWPWVTTYGVTLFSAVPSILSILTSRGRPQTPAPTLQFAICGAAPLAVETHRQFEATFDFPVFEGYGLSETTCYATFNPRDASRRKIGSIGLAAGDEVAIWGEDDQPLGPHQSGEIVIRGDNVMRGYFKRPDATEDAFRGGWFHSGDIGMRDADGFFYILDRVKDMIIRGGENIYPREVDECLYQHPAIADAATIGVPDALYGEDVRSYVVLRDGATLDEAAVIAWCRERLADFKCPKSVRFLAEIPKGPTGKLLRRALRDLAEP
ncbi:MAG: AMP-binding protein [Vampirovibrionales bacterium]|nr:AMP-binding protein [Vampirovibrionales bacterium]